MIIVRSLLAFFAALLLASVAYADGGAPPLRPFGFNPVSPPVSLTGRLTGTFNTLDVVLGRAANTTVSNAQTQLSEITALQLQVSPAFTNLGSGYYLNFDSTNINAANALLFTSSNGWGSTVWFSVGIAKQGTGGSVAPGIVSRSANIYPGLVVWEESAKTVCFGTSDTQRGCWLSGGGLSIDESTGTVSASHAVIYDDSTTHTALLSNNADNFDAVSRSVSAILTSDATNATATLGAITSVTLAAAGRYSCVATGVLSESIAADGFQVNSSLTSGTAGASVSGELYDTAGLHVSGESASSNLTLADTNATDGHYMIRYGAVAGGAGAVWTIKTAQQAHTTGTLTTRAGATATCTRIN